MVVTFILSFLFGILIIIAFKSLFHITLHNNKISETTTVTIVSEVEATTKVTTITSKPITTTQKKIIIPKTTTTVTTKPIVTTTKKIITTPKATTYKPKVITTTKKTIKISNSNKVYLGEFEATAYYCGKWSRCITANGSTPKANHTIAADPKYPFGTKLLINGIIYTVEDRGGAIHNNILDIYFNTYNECINFGRKTVKVYLIK